VPVTPRPPDWIARLSWRTTLAALFCAGVVHISATLAVGMIGRNTAYERLQASLPINRMVLLPPVTPTSQALPFMAPDMRYAVCRFNLVASPVAVAAALPATGWSLALYTPQGDNFYAIPGQELRREDFSFLVSLASDQFIILPPGMRKVDVDAANIVSPTPEGLMVVRAPLRGTAYREETERILKRATCAPAHQ
jgi:uncharacterized membrane protein